MAAPETFLEALEVLAIIALAAFSLVGSILSFANDRDIAELKTRTENLECRVATAEAAIEDTEDVT